MPPTIFGSRLETKGTPAWHDSKGLYVFTDNPLPTAAVKRNNMDFDVRVVPTTFKWNGQEYPTGSGQIIRQPLDGEVAPVVLSHSVSLAYEPVTNMEVAAMLDPLSEKWPVESVGSLQNGRISFISLFLGDYDVAGDPIKSYALAFIPQTGGDAFRFVNTPVRTECWNTLVSGLRAATVTLSTDHRPGAKDRASQVVALLEQLKTSREKVFAQMEALTKKQFTRETIDKIIKAAYPMPMSNKATNLKEEIGDFLNLVSADFAASLDVKEASLTYSKGRTEAFRVGARELLTKFNDEFPKFANTPWAGYNAVTETECYRNGSGKLATQILVGGRGAAMSRAFAEASRLATNA
jgi:hypothetical protein